MKSYDIIKARKLKEKRDEIKTQIDSLAKKVDELTNEKDEEKTNDKTDGEGEERMQNTESRVIPHEVTNEETRAFQSYLETRDIDGDNLKTDSGFVVVPEEVVNEILKLKEKEFNL